MICFTLAKINLKNIFWKQLLIYAERLLTFSNDLIRFHYKTFAIKQVLYLVLSRLCNFAAKLSLYVGKIICALLREHYPRNTAHVLHRKLHSLPQSETMIVAAYYVCVLKSVFKILVIIENPAKREIRIAIKNPNTQIVLHYDAKV